MVKRRHNSISDSEIVTLANRKRQKRCGQNTAYFTSELAVGGSMKLLSVGLPGREKSSTTPFW
jgi:hypothetical protein